MTPEKQQAMTPEQCLQVRGACTKMVEAKISGEIGKVVGKVEQVEMMVKSVLLKLNEFGPIAGRVRDLELWAAKQKGIQIGHHDDDDERQRPAPFQPRVGDNRVVLPKWMIYATIPVLILIVILAALAGERVLPYLTNIPSPPP